MVSLMVSEAKDLFFAPQEGLEINPRHFLRSKIPSQPMFLYFMGEKKSTRNNFVPGIKKKVKNKILKTPAQNLHFNLHASNTGKIKEDLN